MTASIRVLRVIARMNVGGPALQVTALQDGLPKPRFEQRLLIGDVGINEGSYMELRAAHLVAKRVSGLGRSVNASADARALASLVAEIRRFRPHIVHTHTAKAGLLGRTAGLACTVPALVHTFHGHLLHGYFSSRKTRALVAAERGMARFTTRLVAVGNRVRDELIAAGIGRPEQFLVVAPGVELPAAPDRLTARAILGLSPDVPVVAFLARLVPVKRPDRFVDVARVVASRHPETVFLVTGEGELLSEMRRRATPLGDQIRFLGWRSDVETVYAAADVLLLTSDNEGMPVSLIEAASVGCPAVTTAVGSAGEVVVDGVTGFVRDKSTAALADATCHILRNESLRERFSAAAVDYAGVHFGRHRLVNDIAALYEEIAELKGFEADRGPSRRS